MGESVAAGMVAGHLHDLEYKQYDRIAAGFERRPRRGDRGRSFHRLPGAQAGHGGSTATRSVPSFPMWWSRGGGRVCHIAERRRRPPLRVSPLVRRLAGERGEEVRKAKEYLETKVRAAHLADQEHPLAATDPLPRSAKAFSGFSVSSSITAPPASSRWCCERWRRRSTCTRPRSAVPRPTSTPIHHRACSS